MILKEKLKGGVMMMLRKEAKAELEGKCCGRIVVAVELKEKDVMDEIMKKEKLKYVPSHMKT